MTCDLLMIRKGPPSTFYTVSTNAMLETPCLRGIRLLDKDILRTDVLFTELIIL